MKNIDNDIKNGSFKRAYLLFGNEPYLIKEYEERLKNALIPKSAEAMNLSVYKGKDLSVKAAAEAAETMPFFNDYRLIIIKDSGLFSAGRKDDTEAMTAYIKSIPETTVILFSEEKADKRSSLYKAVKKNGYVCEINMLKERELTSWVINASGGRLTKGDAEYFIKSIGVSMSALTEEMKKLLTYVGNNKIKREDIDIACTKSLESNIFDMVGAIGSKNAELALDIYNNLLNLKESPIGILKMIARQFKLILECKYMLKKNYTVQQIAYELSIREFIARDCVSQSRNFTLAKLMNAVKDCADCDIKIKTGAMPAELAVEMVILKYVR